MIVPTLGRVRCAIVHNGCTSYTLLSSPTTSDTALLAAALARGQAFRIAVTVGAAMPAPPLFLVLAVDACRASAWSGRGSADGVDRGGDVLVLTGAGTGPCARDGADPVAAGPEEWDVARHPSLST
jgi:hypothetical protein